MKSLAANGLLTVEGNTTRMHALGSSELRAEIIRRARGWNVQKVPEIRIRADDPASRRCGSAAVRYRSGRGGTKVPYDTLDYLGVSLRSRYFVAHEFETMRLSSMQCPTMFGYGARRSGATQKRAHIISLM